MLAAFFAGVLPVEEGTTTLLIMLGGARLCVALPMGVFTPTPRACKRASLVRGFVAAEVGTGAPIEVTELGPVVAEAGTGAAEPGIDVKALAAVSADNTLVAEFVVLGSIPSP